MIRLITGLPGSGKSLRLVYEIKTFLNEGRAVYVYGVDGLRPFGWLDCENPRAWQDLPDGSVVVVDEAQKIWPARRMESAADDVRALSEHRHRGFDFVLATQQPTYLDKYVRGLVGQHDHMIEQFSSGVARMVTWQQCMDDIQPITPSVISRGTVTFWNHPRDLFDLYTSASKHTKKRRIPLRLKLIPVGLLLVGGFVYFSFGSIGRVVTPPDVSQVYAGSGSGASGDRTGSPLTLSQYLARSMPRVAVMPWSAPLFDDRKPVSQPDIMCVSVEERGCTCYTEQITRLDVGTLDCQRIARYGVYNPYRRSLASQSVQDDKGSGKAGESRDSVFHPAKQDGSL